MIRPIGTSALHVFPIGLGTMGMSEFYGAADDQESIKTLHTALDHGVNFFDTADMYGVGRNEELLRKAFHDRWSDLVLATKFGFERDMVTGERRGINGRPEYVRKACDASLRRLGRDVIDLYYLHRVDPNTPIEETVGAMAELVEAGKVRYLGLSEASGDTLRRACAIHPIVALQSEYSLWSQDVETTSLPVARELGVSLVAYSPLGRGFLTGQIKKYEDLAADDFRRNLPRFQGENFQKNLQLVEEVAALAAEKQCTPSQLALAWLLHQGQDIIPIPGTTRSANLLDNIRAVHVSLSADDLARLASIMQGVQGTRYSEAGMQFVNR